jgi:pilus assembly protein CpaF
LHKELLEKLDLKRFDMRQTSEEDMRKQCRQTLKDIIQDLDPSQFSGISVSELIEDVLDQALGLGPLEDLLKQEEVTEIMVNAYDKIYIEKKGKLTLSDAQFLDNPQVIEVIRRIIAPIGRRIDETNPMVDARLQDGSRVNAIIPPLAISGPSITIRKFATDPFHVEDLIGFNSLTASMASFLEVCVEQRKNIVISGGTGSGKTTLLGVIARYIPHGDRIITIEDAAELKLPQDHVVSLESKPPNIEGQGAIPIRKLVINSLRMRPDRIIVGECRGAEALDMLQAMNTGHDGSLTTLHANTCRDAVSRLETMVMMAGMNLPAKAIREQISSAVDVIVQTNRFPDGTRKISSISVLDGMEGDKITLQEIFAYNMKGYSEDGKVLGNYEAIGGVPAFYRELQERGIAIDLSIFQN